MFLNRHWIDLALYIKKKYVMLYDQGVAMGSRNEGDISSFVLEDIDWYVIHLSCDTFR